MASCPYDGDYCPMVARMFNYKDWLDEAEDCIVIDSIVVNSLRKEVEELSCALKFLLYWNSTLTDNQLNLAEKNAVRLLSLEGKTNRDLYPEIKDYWEKVKNEIKEVE